MTPEKVVQMQLDCYNAHDIEGFSASYSKDIKIYNQGENEPYISGVEALRQRYAERFKLPLLHAELTNRMVLGDTIIDYEHVSGVLEGKVTKAIAIYHVKDNLIDKVWFVREG